MNSKIQETGSFFRQTAFFFDIIQYIIINTSRLLYKFYGTHKIDVEDEGGKISIISLYS